MYGTATSQGRISRALFHPVGDREFNFRTANIRFRTQRFASRRAFELRTIYPLPRRATKVPKPRRSSTRNSYNVGSFSSTDEFPPYTTQRATTINDATKCGLVPFDAETITPQFHRENSWAKFRFFQETRKFGRLRVPGIYRECHALVT